MIERLKHAILIVEQAEIVRTAQKEYFKKRDTHDLNYSKAQERKLDQMIKDFRAGQQVQELNFDQ